MEIQFLYAMAYFVLYSLIGWVLESAYASLYNKRPISRGLLLTPFCPTYGIAALSIIAVTQISVMWWVVPTLYFVITSGIEYFLSYSLEKSFSLKFWNYKNTFLNLNGRICIYSSLVWFLLALFFADIIHPLVERFIFWAPNVLLIVAGACLLVIMASDAVYTTKLIRNLNRRLRLISIIDEKIRYRYEHLHEMLDTQSVRLKAHRVKVLNGFTGQQIRLMKAYPNIISTRYSSELQQTKQILGIYKAAQN